MAKMVKCIICGAVFEEGADVCPVCGVGPENFVPVEDDKTAFSKDTDEKFVILGGGPAARSAAEAVRERNKTAIITIVSKEKHLPYNRPMLTKALLEDHSDNKLAIEPASWYEENRVFFMGETEAVGINVDNKEVAVVLADGSRGTVAYDKLIYALGAYCFVAPIPGSELEHVLTVRNISDTEAIRKVVAERDVKNVVCIGGGAQVSVQSMLNVPSTDIEGSVNQAKKLEAAGCQIIRAAIPDMDAVKLIPALKEAVSVPIVADIHFNYKLALEACAAGIDKIRINPGNIGSDDRVKAVADACRARNIPIRIGVNSGSLEKEILAKYGHPTPQALCDSALYHASLLEKFDFTDIVLSMKSSTVSTMIQAYELAAQQCDYPLHLGVTEAGTERMGIIKSAAGIGSLLLHGIGDTIRVSLTADPVREVYAAYDILKALDIKKDGIQFVSCPTCGRTCHRTRTFWQY